MQVENLKSYLANIGMTLKDFCELIDCDDKHMSNIIHGKKMASHRLAKDVKEATSGLISLPTRPRKRDLKRQQAQNHQQHACAV